MTAKLSFENDDGDDGDAIGNAMGNPIALDGDMQGIRAHGCCNGRSKEAEPADEELVQADVCQERGDADQRRRSHHSSGLQQLGCYEAPYLMRCPNNRVGGRGEASVSTTTSISLTAAAAQQKQEPFVIAGAAYSSSRGAITMGHKPGMRSRQNSPDI